MPRTEVFRPKFLTLFEAWAIMNGPDGESLDQAQNPDRTGMEEGVLYVANEVDGTTEVDYLCPCGCRTKMCLWIRTPNLGNVHPSWDLTVKGEKGFELVTLNPSILYKAGCHSHYYIRDNKVCWY